MGAAQHAGVFLPAVRACALLMLAVLAIECAAAPPDVTSLFPAGGAPSETVNVTATGTFANWPVQVWTSDPRLHVECEKDKGKLLVKIADDAPLGIAWLRLIDADGASAPRPFVIAAQPSLREKEPNDTPKQAQQIVSSAVVQGKFDKKDDSDTYRIELTAGQTLVASLQANQILGSPADGALQICNAAGQVLAMNQDAGGLDSLVSYRAGSAGSYLVRTFALPAVPNSSINFAGGELFIYRLTITTGPFADYSLPLAISRAESTPLKLQGWNLLDDPSSLESSANSFTEPWYWTPPNAAGLIPLRRVNVPIVVATAVAASKEGQSISAPCCLSGVIGKPREVHRFTFEGKKGTKLAVVAESANLDFDLDPFLKLLSPDGKTVVEADDMGKDRDPSLNATLATDGVYIVELRDLHRSGGPRHVYRLTIETPQPRLMMTVTAGNYSIEVGKTLEIPVAISRQNGLSGEFTITAVDLPEGVSAMETVSQNKGDTAKQVKLMFTATAEAKAGPFRIIARDSEGQELAGATFSQTLGGSTFQHSSLWLAVKGSK